MTDLERIERKLDIILAYIEEQQLKPSVTLYEWLDTWYKVYKVPALKPGSLRCIRDTIRLHIKPNISDCPLAELKPIELQRCLSAISSSRMAEYSHNTLTDCMRRAYEQGYTSSNLMDTVKKPRHKRVLGHSLTLEQQNELLSFLPALRHGNIFAFYLLTGCRRSEAMSLTWNDVDLEKHLLHIRGTKTETSDRFVPIFPKLEKLISELPRSSSERLFPFSDSTLKREYEKLRALCSFDFTIHSLRHTYITRLHELGIDDKVIQKWAGHSSVATTQRIYIHVMTEQELIQFNKLKNSDLF